MGQLGYGIIGAGKVAMRHMSCAESMAETQLVAISDLNREKAEQIAAARTQPPAVYGDWHELLADPRVDVVVVCVPTQFHAEVSIAAAAAGKHIYCEKAMAPTLGECDAMIEAARRHQIKLNIGQSTRFMSTYAMAQRLVEAGEMGEVIAVNAFFSDKSMLREQVGEDFWRYKAGAQGHGCVINFGCHWIDTARFISGQEPVRVCAHIGNRYSCDPEDQFVITALCDGQALMTIGDYGAPQLTNSPRNGFIIYGEKAVLHAFPGEGLTLQRAGETPVSVAIDDDLQGETWLRFHQALVASILNDTPVPVSGLEGRRNLEWALAAYLAHEQGCWIDLPLGPEYAEYGGPRRLEEIPPGG
jgi:predicted dehydrogenase